MNRSSDLERRLLDLVVANGLLAALIVFVLSVAAARPSLLRWASLEGIIRQTTDIAVVVFPLALLVISGSVDLSVGSVADLSGIVMARVAVAFGFPAGVLAGLGLGLAIGALNGVLVSYLGLHPVVATLGGLTLWRGVALLTTNAQTIGMGTVPEAVLDFGIGLRHVLFLPVHFYVLLITYLVCWGAAHKHTFGERLFAVGGMSGQPSSRDQRQARAIRRARDDGPGRGARGADDVHSVGSRAWLGRKRSRVQRPHHRASRRCQLPGGMGKMRGVIVALFFMSFLRHSLVLLKTPCTFSTWHPAS